MVGIWTFDAANNVLTVVGGSSGSPAGFVDAWNADKAGTRTLKAAAASPFTASLDTAVKPADSLALKLSAVITNFSVAGTVTLTGKDAWGNAISEVRSVAGNGTVVSTLYYTSIDPNGMVAVGTFTAAITQPRWGVVWKQSATQYQFDCHFVVGDNSTSTYFKDTKKQVSFNSAVQLTCLVRAAASFQLGEIYGNGNVYDGCTFMLTNTVTNTGFPGIGGTCGNLYFYDSLLNVPSFWTVTNGDSQICKIIGCTVQGWAGGRIQGASSLIKDSVFHDGINFRGLSFKAPTPTVDNIRFTRNVYAIYHAAQYAGSVTVKNPVCKNNTYAVSIWSDTTPNYLYIVNGDFDSWNFYYFGASVAITYRQYEFDLTTEPGASVTLKNAAGATVFSVTADAVTGAIATQTVSRGYYDYAHGNTLQDYGPFTLTITEAAKMPYTQTGIVLSEKTKLLVALRDQLTGTATAANVAAGATFYEDDADAKLVGSHVNPAVLLDVASGKLVLNLNNKKLDNQLVLGL